MNLVHSNINTFLTISIFSVGASLSGVVLRNQISLNTQKMLEHHRQITVNNYKGILRVIGKVTRATTLTVAMFITAYIEISTVIALFTYSQSNGVTFWLAESTEAIAWVLFTLGICLTLFGLTTLAASAANHILSQDWEIPQS